MMMTPAEAASFIKGTGGLLLSVRFVKRSDQSLREMVCRIDVHKYLAGGERAYNPEDHDLIWVWEPAVGPRKKGDRGYRSIPIEGIIAVKCGPEWIEVSHD